jgi:hypothetical protein
MHARTEMQMIRSSPSGGDIRWSIHAGKTEMHSVLENQGIAQVPAQQPVARRVVLHHAAEIESTLSLAAKTVRLPIKRFSVCASQGTAQSRLLSVASIPRRTQ